MELMSAIVGLFPFFASNLKKLIFMTSSCPFLFERKVTFDGNCHVDGELQIWYQTSR